MKRLLMLLLLPIALAGCDLTGLNSAGSSPVNTSSTLADERALYAAEAVYYSAVITAQSAVSSGLATPGSPRALTIADALDVAYQAILRARRIQAATESGSLLEQITAIYGAVADVQRALAGGT